MKRTSILARLSALELAHNSQARPILQTRDRKKMTLCDMCMQVLHGHPWCQGMCPTYTGSGDNRLAFPHAYNL